MRLGERGLGASPCSSLESLLSLDLSGGGTEWDEGDSLGSMLAKKGLLEDALRPGEAKSKLPRANPRLFSDCFLNCSNSGFCSTGIILGDAAAMERTLDVGGLQLPRMCWAALEEKWSALLTARPK